LAPLVLLPVNVRPYFKEEPPSMKKLLTLLATLVIAVSMSMPVFAQDTGGQETQTSQPKVKKEKKAKKAKSAKKEKKSKKEKKEKTEPAPGQ
jgi:ABC-type transporter MlaC component